MGDNLSPFATWIIYGYPYILLGGGVVSILILWLRVQRGHFALVHPPRPWRLGWTDFLILIWLLFSWMLVASGVIGRIFPGEATPSGDSMIWRTVMEGALAQIGMATLFLGYRYFQPFESRSPINSHRQGLTGALVTGLLLFFASIPWILIGGAIWMVVLEFLRGMGIDLPVDQQELVGYFSDAESPLAFAALLILATVVAPIAEELVFRAGVYRFFKSRYTRNTAIMISSVVFALLHMNVLILPSLIVLGVFLCIAYELTGNIRTSIALHSFFNLNTIVMIVLQDMQ